MPLTRKRATIWTCSDGTEFTSIEKAANHEIEVEFKQIITRSGVGRGGDWDDDMIIQALWERRSEFEALFRKSKTAFRREAVPADREAGKS